MSPAAVRVGLAFLLLACGEDPGGADPASSADAEAQTADASIPDAADPDATPAEPDAAAPAVTVTPTAPEAYAGTCPVFEPGRNTIPSYGKDRSFLLFEPEEPEGAPVLFLWHPLGGNAQWMANAMEAQQASERHGMIIAVPNSQGGLPTEWGYLGDAQPDLAVFDDLLFCLLEQYAADSSRVYIAGFSAGALWSSYLVVHRAEYLAAAVILSGGVGMFFEYETPAFNLPVLLAWGGPRDTFQGFVHFDQLSMTFRDALVADGHFVVECVHNGGHVPPPGVTGWGYNFATVHQERTGASPLSTGLDFFFPEICSIASPTE